MQFQAERSALETCVLQLSGKKVALERWTAENESKMPEGVYHLCPHLHSVAANFVSRVRRFRRDQALIYYADDSLLPHSLTDGIAHRQSLR